MGIFNFLKKSKSDTPAMSMELPPIPKIEGMEGFPEIDTADNTKLPDNSLPPLPTDVPGAVPPKPVEKEMTPPKMDLPEAPKMGATPEKIAAPEDIGLPDLPELPHAPMPPADVHEEPAITRPEFPVIPEEHPIDTPEEHEDIPTKKEIEDVMSHSPDESVEGPSFPSTPELPGHDTVPETIPPLEGIPEAPDFNEEPVPKYIREKEELMESLEPEPIAMPAPAPRPIAPIPEEMHPAYFTPEPEPVMTMRPTREGPMFIRTDRYKAIIDDVEQVKATFSSEDDIFSRISDVKSAQDQKYEEFRQTLEDIQRKLLFIDRSLFESTSQIGDR